MKTKIVFITGAFCLALMSACDESEPPVKTWEDKWADSRRQMEQRYQCMTDSAMLLDLSLADIHFEPHSTLLSELGKNRLARYAELLGEQGGTLYLESAVFDEDFNMARVQSVIDYLSGSGIPGDRIAAVTGQRRGAGMAGVEAIEVKAIQYDPNRPPLTDIVSGGTGGQFGTE